MKNFDIRRFGALLGYDFQVYGPKMMMWCLLFLLAAPVICFAISFRYALGVAEIIFLGVMPLAFMGIIIEMVCSKFAKPATANYYVTLPATMLEKWLATMLESVFFLVVVNICLSNVGLWIVQAIVSIITGSPIHLDMYFSIFLKSEGWMNANFLAMVLLSFAIISVKWRIRLGQIATSVAFLCFIVGVLLVWGAMMNLLGMNEYGRYNPIEEFSVYVMPFINVLLVWYSYHVVCKRNIY